MQTPTVILPLLGGIGLTEWIIIGLAIVFFFGATKLPKLGRGLGEGIRNFKKGIKGELGENGNPLAEDASSADQEGETAPADDSGGADGTDSPKETA